MKMILLSQILLINLIADITIGEVHKNPALSIDVEKKELPKQITKSINIKENGIKSTMQIPINKKSRSLSKIKKEGVIVDFLDDFSEAQTFADEFNLTLGERLSIGYYIFENSSNLSDEDLIESILSSTFQENIKTIRPNWKMGVVAF